MESFSRIEEYLKKDSSYQYVSPLSKTVLGKILFTLFGGKPQTKDREIYESAAKIYYEKGFHDGQSICDTVNNHNVEKENYDMVMRLLSLMGLSFNYFYDIPQVQRDSLRKVTGVGFNTIPFHSGLNLVRKEESHITDEEDLYMLREIINYLFKKAQKKIFPPLKNNNAIDEFYHPQLKAEKENLI